MHEKNELKRGLIFSVLVMVLMAVVAIDFAYALGPAQLDLGTAGDFVILSKAGITNVPASAIVGNVGVSPINGVANGLTCAEVTGLVYSVDATGPAPCSIEDPSRLSTAVSDMETAYTTAAGLPADFTELHAGDLSGQTLVPGTYKWGTGVMAASDFTLSGGPDDVWVFQIAQDLIVSNGVIMHLSGGARAENIFWQVAGQATLGTTTQFEGTILSQTAINLQTGASINGNLLAQTDVTLQGNAVTKPASAPVVDTAAPFVFLMSPGNDTNTTENVTLVFNATDSVQSEVTCDVFVDLPNGQGATEFTATGINMSNIVNESIVLGLTNGLHNWSIGCYDLAGNYNASDIWYFTVENGTNATPVPVPEPTPEVTPEPRRRSGGGGGGGGCASGWHYENMVCVRDVVVQPVEQPEPTPVPAPVKPKPIVTEPVVTTTPVVAVTETLVESTPGNQVTGAVVGGGSSSWIWFGVLALAIIGGIIAYFVMRKK
jgi:hypothetical protein